MFYGNSSRRCLSLLLGLAVSGWAVLPSCAAAPAAQPPVVGLAARSVSDRQAALSAAAGASGPDGTRLIGAQLDALLDRSLPRELELDVIEAAGKSQDALIQQKLAKYEASLPKEDALAPYRRSLFGGVAEEGRKLFLENQQIACVKCHKVRGEGGEAGPELTGISLRKPREYILESIVFPNRQIAAGFENVIVTLKNGMSYAGLVKSENASEMVINSPEDGILTVKIPDIAKRERGLSPMPEQLASFLTPRELRNLIEFLATLK